MTDSLRDLTEENWAQKVLAADAIWAQVKKALVKAEKELPMVSRRPDVRLIVRNASREERRFLNPGDYTEGKEECILPSQAAMVMLQGDTLSEQYRNAQDIVSRYGLGTKGLSQEFCQAIGNGHLVKSLKEAYGPAVFDEQTSKLTELQWDNDTFVVTPDIQENSAIGARAPGQEQVFKAEFLVFVHGTVTNPEKTSDAGICIAVSENWETQEEETRPINLDVAKTFYGSGMDHMAVVNITPDGKVLSIDLGQDVIIDLLPEELAVKWDGKPYPSA